MQRLWHSVRGGPLALFVLTLLLVVTAGLLAGQRPALAAPPRQGGEGEDHAGQSCGDCHLDFRAAWESGVHAIAFTRESFQASWNEHNQDSSCLDCHTTRYQPSVGEYMAENIVCEACHGLNPADHPPEQFVINRAPDACGNCHTHTFEEWRNSRHAFTPDMGTVGCATCHNPHGQTVRFENNDDLCLNCHESAPNTYVHLTHNEVDFESVGVEVTCASCHMYRSQGLGGGTNDDVQGHRIPDHTMTVKTTPCTDCHEALSGTGDFTLLVDVDMALAQERDELRAQVNELEATVAEFAYTESCTDYARLTQGLIFGLGLGGTIIWVLLRRNGGSHKSNEDRHE